jgi:hypothetical protein
MATPPKPDDKTVQLPVGPEPSGKRPPRKSDPRLRAQPRLGADPETPSYTQRDLYAGSRTDVKPLAPGRAAAAEVSQGAWRERAFAPRGVMSADEIVGGLQAALEQACAQQGERGMPLAPLRERWLPFLRQAVEQAGGDCLDAWLSAALRPGSGPVGSNPVLIELYATFEKMRAAPSPATMFDVAREAIAIVKAALVAPSKRPCSFKVLERELEGKIDVDGLILFLLFSETELAQRATEIGQTLERIRDEMKKMPGAKPDGMYSNFARLKAEARLIDGELKRRTRVTSI